MIINGFKSIFVRLSPLLNFAYGVRGIVDASPVAGLKDLAITLPTQVGEPFVVYGSGPVL